MRWPNLSVDSARFKSLPMPERLYQLGRAFIDTAIALCEAAGQRGASLDWPTASVCLYCKYLGSPDPQYDFPVSLTFRPRDVDGLFGIELDGIDLKPDEILRYGGDKEGNSSSLTHVFAPGYQLNVLQDLHERATRIWASLPAG
jgi:hypothetical protein